MGEDLGLLAQFKARGAIYLTLTHNGHNLLADSSNPRTDLGDGETLHGGLSELGKAAIGELNRLGMLVDISHVSQQAALQAAMVSKTPVVATHSCVRALCDVPRNVDDLMIEAMRDCGGLINVTAVPSFVRKGGKAAEVTVVEFRRSHRLHRAPGGAGTCGDQFGLRWRRRVLRLARRGG